MRPLTDEETISLLTKLKTYIGDRIRHLLNNESDPHVFRIQRGRVYYMSTAILGHCGNFQRKVLTCAGTKFGRFNKSGDFRLHVTALDYLAQHALCKVWLKPAAEMSFLFGNHVMKSGVGKMSEGVVMYGGVVLFNMSGVALGFGVAAQDQERIRELEPTGVVVLRQADAGEYLRDERLLM